MQLMPHILIKGRDEGFGGHVEGPTSHEAHHKYC